MKKIYTASLVGLATFFSLNYSMIWIKGQDTSLDISLRYLLVAFILAAITFFMQYVKWKLALITNLIFFTGATLYIVIFAQKTSEGFTDLGRILTWMILVATGIIGGFLIQGIAWIWNRYHS